MLAYKPVSYRLAVAPPRVLRQAPKTSVGLGHPSSHVLGQRFEDVLGWSGAAGDLLRTGFHTATAVLGYRVWIADKGFWKYFGLILAVGQTVGAICDLISLGKRIAGTHPAETEH